MSESMQTPNKHGYTIYTKSDCIWCTHAKRVFADATFICCDMLLKDRDTFLKQMDKYTGGHRTFPMVFYKGEFVGGYSKAVQQIMEDIEF